MRPCCSSLSQGALELQCTRKFLWNEPGELSEPLHTEKSAFPVKASLAHTWEHFPASYPGPLTLPQQPALCHILLKPETDVLTASNPCADHELPCLLPAGWPPAYCGQGLDPQYRPRLFLLREPHPLLIPSLTSACTVFWKSHSCALNRGKSLFGVTLEVGKSYISKSALQVGHARVLPMW